ncbi:hypothetical protein N8I77_011449 [Diaporthe amygdali]|uniref:Heterokaryon incompatibility domain-containing protein n=1 Tax=Phomopsis amygdali TaxID=1214568 RepID=A0AAD9S5P9_PHOAM|nr:hypothetical protein N8I77_011449 [Diaporthe amygdali]
MRSFKRRRSPSTVSKSSMVSETSTVPESSMSPDSSGWSTTSEPTEGIVLTDHAAVHGARLDSSKKQIRLLQIIPLEADHDPKDETVRCRMFKTYLNDFDPLFNALSYTWGSPDEQTNIVVNDTTVSVTTNLESALRHLRDYHLNTTCGFPLWVDAICINQDDTEEQNSQVEMMGQIYEGAARVLPWLGEGNVDTDWLLPLLRDVDFCAEAAQQAKQVDGPAPGPLIIRAVAISMDDLCRRSWWSRLWVVQEIMLAKRDPIILIGSGSVPWSEYVTVFQNLNRIDNRIRFTKKFRDERNNLWVTTQSNLPFMVTASLPGLKAWAWNDLRSYIQNKGERKHMHPYLNSICALLAGYADLLGQSARRKADYVYALRALFPIEEQRLIGVDYSKPPMEVFHDAMIAVWTSPYSSRWLSRVLKKLQYRHRGILDNAHDIPSWVPDLSQQDDSLRSSPFPSTHDPLKQPIVRISSDRRTLTFHGIYFDAVTETCAVRIGTFFQDPFWSHDPNLSDLRRATQCITEALSRKPPSSSVLHALGILHSREQDTYSMIRTFMDHISLDSLSKHKRLVHAMLRMLLPMDDLCNALNSRLKGNLVFGTDAGSFGVGPDHMEAGDRIVFPFGMEVPIVVRPMDPEHPETHEYSLIGVADIPDLSELRMELEKAIEDKLLDVIEIHLK